MGGDNRQSQPQSLPVRDLVYRTEADDSPKSGYSDDYTERLMGQRKKKMDDMMAALSRLGVIDQLQPQGFVPMIPYRPIETQIGF